MVCLAFSKIKTIKEKCANYIIVDRIEIYYGLIQNMNGKSLKDFIYNVYSDFLLNNMEISLINFNLSKINLPASDHEIINWIEYMANSHRHSQKLKKCDAIKNDFEKFCLLVVFAYNFSSFSDEFEISLCNTSMDMVSQDKQMILKLIEDCYEILKSENEFNKKISDWSLNNFEIFFQ